MHIEAVRLMEAGSLAQASIDLIYALLQIFRIGIDFHGKAKRERSVGKLS